MAASSQTLRSLLVRPLLTGSEVGEILGYTPRQVRTLAASGELRRVVLGHRSTRYLVDDVEAYIERHIHPAKTNGAPATGTPLEKEKPDVTSIAARQG